MKTLLSALLSVLFLAGCGFQPLYSEKTSIPVALDQVEIALIPDQEGVSLRNALIDQFYKSGYPSNPRYTLEASKINIKKSNLDITKESDTTRTQLRLRTTIQLIDLETQKAVFTREVTAITSYNVVGSQFTTRVSQRAARENAIQDLAGQIEQAVALYLRK